MKHFLIAIVFFTLTNSMYSQTNELTYEQLRAHGLFYFHKGDYLKSLKYFNQAIESPERPKVYDVDLLIERVKECAKYRRLAIESYDIGYYYKSLENYRQLAKFNPSDEQCKKRIEELNSFVKDKDIYTFKSENVIKVNESILDERPEQGYYITIFSFRNKKLAKEEAIKELEKGIAAEIVYHKKRKWYYIYSHTYKNLMSALLKLEEMQKKGYIDAKIHVY